MRRKADVTNRTRPGSEGGLLILYPNTVAQTQKQILRGDTLKHVYWKLLQIDTEKTTYGK